MEQQAAELPVPDWHERELEERAARLDSGEEPVSSWAEAKERLHQQSEYRRKP